MVENVRVSGGRVVADDDGLRGRAVDGNIGPDVEHDGLVRLGFLVVDDADREGALRHPGSLVPAAFAENAEGGTVANITDCPEPARPGGGV